IRQEALGQDLRLPGSVVTIGNFDGLHLGHQALIRKASEWAKKGSVPVVVMTFKPHPLQVLRPESLFQTMSTVEDLGFLLRPFEIDYLWVRHFTKELAGRPPEQFLQEDLKAALNPVAVVVGADFRFGAGHRG